MALGIAPDPVYPVWEGHQGSLRSLRNNNRLEVALRSGTLASRLSVPITMAFAALYVVLLYGAFPGPGDVPVLDLIALETLSPTGRSGPGATPPRPSPPSPSAASPSASPDLSGAPPAGPPPLLWTTGPTPPKPPTAFSAAGSSLPSFLAPIALAWSIATRPFPAPGDVPVLDLVELEDPGFYAMIRGWHLLIPSVLAFGGVLILTRC